VDGADRLKAGVGRFWEDVLGKGDVNGLGKGLSPSYTFNGQPQSGEQVAAWITSLHQQMPDLVFTVNDLLGEGEQVAIRWTLVATRDGQKVTTSGTNIITFGSDGLALSNWQNGGIDFTPVTT
jgi:predicted ester cyclase